MVAKEERKSRIPEFASYEEEARFWDEHDLTEFEDEFEPVEIEFDLPLGHIISMRLESDEFHRLVAVAKSRDANFVSLAREWVLEALAHAEVVDGTGGGERSDTA